MKLVDMPLGPFWLPTLTPGIERHSAICARNVLEGEYSYERPAPESVYTLVDVGCNIGAFAKWALEWWPTLETIHGYDPNASALEVASRNVPGTLFEWAAVTSQDRARLEPATDDADNWGGAHTFEAREGFYVPVVHPRDLPPCDALKVDAEGVEVEVLAGYMHLGGCRVVMYEYHRAEHRASLAILLHSAGFVCVRQSSDPNATQDTCVWVRR